MPDYLIKVYVTVRAESPDAAEDLTNAILEAVREVVDDTTDHFEVTADDPTEV
jgi:capsular polysaccharide biosynthesis protein